MVVWRATPTISIVTARLAPPEGESMSGTTGRGNKSPELEEGRLGLRTKTGGPFEFIGAGDAEQRQRSGDEMVGLATVARLVASGADESEVFVAAAQQIGVLSGASAIQLLRLEIDGSRRPVATWPTDAESPRGDWVVTVSCPVTGQEWGDVAIDRSRGDHASADIEGLINDFLALVVLALDNAEVREALAASRRRFVNASDESRKVIEEELDAGPRRRLSDLEAELRLARDTIWADPEAMLVVLAGARRRVDAGLAELQSLARGIHPVLLTDRGLDVALDDLVGRCAVPVTLDSSVRRRLGAVTELAGYYVVAAGLSNIAAHAHARSSSVEARVESQMLLVTVTDDGVGGARIGHTGELLQLSDRVGSLGGEILVVSPIGAGTALQASIPVSGDG
jgi:signal transduction histidine kinase